ncbi:MAG TPA: Gfo/Idh/MocA family oxidoreductase, partial [Acidimicrobiales bacterium]|nr:Gfo/Idh/MocA family oxidoreductase [Acidimicrobiales bacterium]
MSWSPKPNPGPSPASASPYAVGIIGTGFNAHEHAHRLSQLPDVALGPVYDIDSDKAARFAQEFGGHVAGSIDELVAESSAVFICTWTSEHVAVIETVMR